MRRRERRKAGRRRGSPEVSVRRFIQVPMLPPTANCVHHLYLVLIAYRYTMHGHSSRPAFNNAAALARIVTCVSIRWPKMAPVDTGYVQRPQIFGYGRCMGEYILPWVSLVADALASRSRFDHDRETRRVGPKVTDVCTPSLERPCRQVHILPQQS